MSCDPNEIINHHDDICKYVSTCDYSFINFFYLHYCSVNSITWISVPIILIIGAILFFLLSDTSNRYLSSALTNISNKLGISQNLAGLTFLAFGNGSPDVITSIVASDGEEGGIDFSVAALVGSGVFLTTLVMSFVVFFGKSVKVVKAKFTRDIILFILSLIIIIVFGLDGKISIWESLIIFSIYFVYVIIACIQDKYDDKPDEIMTIDDTKTEYLGEDIIKKYEVFAEEDDVENVLTSKNDFEKISEEKLVSIKQQKGSINSESIERISNVTKQTRSTGPFKRMIRGYYSNIRTHFKKRYLSHDDV